MTVFTKLRTSAVNLYRAIPRDRKTLAAIHRQKVREIRKAGISGLAYDFARNFISLVDFGRYCLLSRTGSSAFSPFSWNLEDVHASYPLSKYVPDALAMEMARYIPPIRTPFTLADRKRGYTCYQLPIVPENREKVEQARALVATALQKYGYEGWSNDIDRFYDAHAFYFVAEDSNGRIVATSRLVNRVGGNTIPLEDGVRPDGSHYSLDADLDKGGIADVNSFYFASGHARALMPLFAVMARYGTLAGVRRSYCMLDIRNEKIRQIYLRAGYRFSKRFADPIYYPTFGGTDEGGFHPTKWTIMEMGKLRILVHAVNSFRYRLV